MNITHCATRRLAVLASIVFAFAASAPSRAATYTWDASGTVTGGNATDGSGTWSTTGTNWDLGGSDSAWPNGNNAVFGNANGAAGTVTVSGSVGVANITFNAPGSGSYTITSGTIGLASSTITVNAASATIGSILAGSTGLTVGGAGTLILANAANTYTGTTTVNSGGTLQIGDGVSNNGLVNGAITDSGTLVFANPTAQTYSQVIGGTGAVKISGPGNETFTALNTYSGGTVVNSGTLTLGATSVASTGIIVGALTINSGGTVNASNNWAFGYQGGTCVSSITINGGILNFTGAGDPGGTSASSITMTSGTISGSTFDWYYGITANPTLITNASAATAVISAPINLRLAGSASNNLTFNVAHGTTGGADLLVSGAISQSQSGGIIKTGAGLMVLSATNTYNGTTTISGGTLQLGDGVSNNGVVPGNITDNATLAFANPFAQTYSNVISGSGAVTVSGPGVETLTALNTYSGGTVVNSGTLTLGAQSGASNGTIIGALTINSGATVSAAQAWAFGYANGTCVSSITINGGTLNFTGAGGGNTGGTSASSIAMTSGTISGSLFDWYSGITPNPTLTTNASAATAVISAPINLRLGASTNNLTFNVAHGTTGGADLLVSGAISQTQSGGIIKTGAGLMVLSATNTYNGTTTISGGTLQLGNGVSNNGVVPGNITDNATLAFANPFAQTYSNVISGSGAVTVSGPGVETLSSVNTYTGATTINAGTLKFINSQSNVTTTAVNGGTLSVTGTIGAGAVSINGGGTLYGTGVINGAVTVAGGTTAPAEGTINLVDGSTGTLTLSGGLTIGGAASNFSILDFEATGSGADLLALGGSTFTENAGGAGINITNLGGIAAGHTYNLLTYTGTAGAGFATGSGVTVGDLTLDTTSFGFGVSGSLLVSSTAVQLVTAGAAAPATAYWSGTTGATWSGTNVGGGNFTTDAAGTTQAQAYPASTSAVVFSASNAQNFTNTLGTNFDVASVAFSGTNAVTINADGNKLSIEAGGLALNPGAGAVSIGANMGANQTEAWMNNSSNNLTISGTVSGAGALTLGGTGSGNTTLSGPVTGAGTLTLSNSGSGATTLSGAIGNGASPLAVTNQSGITTISGSNTYSGTTTLSGGQLNINNANALGVGTNTFVINGGTIDNTNSSLTTLANYPMNWNGNFTFAGSNALSLGAGAVALAGTNVTVTVNANTLTVGGVISGTGSLTLAGNGTLSLTAVNTYGGGTVVNSGTLTLAGQAGASAGTIRGSLTINSGGTVNASNNWAFGYANGTCVSAITINGGTLNFTGAGDPGGTSASSITMTGGTISGSTFDWYYDITNNPTLITNASATTAVISAPINLRLLTGNALTFNVARGTTGSGIDLLVSGAITQSQSGGITKTGAGVMELTAANSYDGNTTISGGVLTLGSGGSLQNTSSITIASGATLNLSGNSNNELFTTSQTGSLSISGTLDNTTNYANTLYATTITLNNGAMTSTGGGGGTAATYGAYYVNAARTITANGSNNTISGNGGVGLTAALNLNTPLATDAVIVSSTLGYGTSGSGGGLTKSGSGTVTLTAANLYTGATTISGGTLQLGDGVSSNGSVIGNITDNATLAFANPSSQTFAGVVSGSGGVTVSGPGVETLTNTSTYSGATNVTGGTLIVSGSLNGTSGVNVIGGTLGGGGLIGNNVVVGTGSGAPSIIEPSAGGGAVGTVMTLNSNLTLSGTDAAFEFTLNSSAPGTPGSSFGTSDGLLVSGTLTLGGTLTGLDTGSTVLAPGSATYLLAFDANGINGTFIGIPENGLVQVGQNWFTVDYGITNPDELVLTAAVPEPATWAMMVGGLGMLVGLQKTARRRRL